MKKTDKKLKLPFLLLPIWVGFLFFLVMTNASKLHAQPAADSLLATTSVNINGETWTFRTPPPSAEQRQVISGHPRLFLTKDNLPGIREKLDDLVYANDMNQLRDEADSGSAIASAFLYLLEEVDLEAEEEKVRGNAAKNWLLSGNFGDVKGLEIAGEWVEPILVFDWVFPLLTPEEKERAFERIKSNFNYNPSDRGKSRYWNDVWARHQELHYPILALAIAGDGINDKWAQDILKWVYDEDPRVMGPYGPIRGSGFLDMLASVSLDDGGGSQAGTYGKLGQGYYAMYLHSFLPMGAWETATTQPMWARSDFFRKLPSHWAYIKNKAPSNLGQVMPEFLTGIYRDIDPDAAALARWMVEKWGRHKSLLVHRLILGDLRVVPKSPQELGLPTAKYIRGSDLFVSSRTWDNDVLTLSAYSRYMDTNRYEPSSGSFAIHRGQEPLAVPAEPNKTAASEGYFSGLWIYDPSNPTETKGQNSTYWGLGPNRANHAYEAVSQAGYFPGGPDNIIINNTYRGISTEYAKLLKAPGVRTARQSILHIMDENRDFIVAYNYSDVPTNLRRAWSMRLAVPPDITANAYSIPGMYTTIVGPLNHTISWVGGKNDEMRSPPPEKKWYGKDAGADSIGYSDYLSDLYDKLGTDAEKKEKAAAKVKANGLGNLFVKSANNAPEQLEFLLVIEVGNQSPVPVSRISDREVRFGDWHVSFSPDGDFSVVNTGEFPPDTTPPSPPTNLSVQ
ncbi:MAG: hypothetical protein GXO96_03705 [Nitrospirae bacterium]|nr:hypothetical protein [Candidatus Manganitrophaceae bacterium]